MFLYQHIPRGTVLVPRKDRVLDSRSMLESAQQAGPRLNVVKLEGSVDLPAARG